MIPDLLAASEVGPGKHPLLEFSVRRPDGKRDAWGWFVGTSSLDDP